ncbi:MAG: ArsR family transcriptional regulator [Spirochaetales bacterium]|nr:MAG: ArsR family transcriptional regulator [Spirochaetales bacterium]
MPLLRSAERDSLTSLVQFKTSLVFEMLLSLQAAVHEWQRRDWTEEVRSVLGEGMLKELKSIYDSFNDGCGFTEIAIDYPDYHDVTGFIRYVRGLDERTFVFYVLGRVHRLEELPEKPSKKALEELTAADDFTDGCRQTKGSFDWADDIGGLKTRLTALWQRYWDGFFRERSGAFEPGWLKSISEKEDVLFNQGGTRLLSQLSSKKHETLPDPLPPEIPYTLVQCIPVCTIYRPFLMFYGYGNVTLLYDCSIGAPEGVQAEKRLQDILKTARALSDENRLKIIRFLSEEDRCCNGKQLAERLGISPSVVSRHLGQLKEAGLIEEVSQDNRNLSYSVKREKIGRLSDEFLDYIRNYNP